MWNNFYYNTGSGGPTTQVVKVYSPVYDVTYEGESSRLVYYKPPRKTKISYIGEGAQKLSYVKEKNVGVRYTPERKIKIRFVC